MIEGGRLHSRINSPVSSALQPSKISILQNKTVWVTHLILNVTNLGVVTEKKYSKMTEKVRIQHVKQNLVQFLKDPSEGVPQSVVKGLYLNFYADV